VHRIKTPPVLRPAYRTCLEISEKEPADVAMAPHPRARLIDFRLFSKAGLPSTMSKNLTPIRAWERSADVAAHDQEETR